MNIELKNVKVYPRLSSDSTAFNATVYVDGKKAFEAKDDGNGGCIDFDPIGHDYTLLHEAEAYAKSLPPLPSEFFPDGLEMDLELLIGTMLEDYQNDKRLARICKKSTLFSTPDCKEGEYRSIKRPASPEVIAFIMGKYPTAVIYQPKG